MNAGAILHFWFEELSTEDWWVKNDIVDQDITQRFLAVHQQATAEETRFLEQPNSSF